MSKNCIITTVKSKIKGNATSYIEKENEIFIPISKKFTLNQTRAMAQDKVNKINKEYLSEKFGEVVSLNSSYTDGTGINIHPSQRLVDAYEVKEGNKTLEEINSNRDLEYFNGDEALLEQEQNEDNLIQKELDDLVEQTNNIEENAITTPEIKEGVEELFESNPEFSSQIYEALGFSKKLDFYKGDTLAIDEKIYSIVEKISSKELAKRNGLTISSNIPVYIVSEFLGARKGGYDTVNNIIILSKDSDKETIHHELIHSVEYNLDKSELNPLYEKVKNSITEDSFDGFISWNFRKNISEFVADALSKKAFRNALKKEGLLEEVDNVLSIYTSGTTPQQKQQATFMFSEFLDVYLQDFEQVEKILKEEKIIDKKCS